MGQVSARHLRTPHGKASGKQLRARIDRQTSTQSAAASGTDTQVVEVAGDIMDLVVTAAGVPAAGESLTIDVQKNGVSVLTAPLVFDSTAGGKQKKFTPNANNPWKAGDLLTVIRTYVAGGGPTPIGPNRVTLEIAN